jgi:hypothetical protein
LKSIFLPGSVENLSGLTFDFQRVEIEIDSESRFLEFCDDFFLGDADGHFLIRYLGDSPVIVISNEINRIAAGCFYRSQGIAALTFESGSRLLILDKLLFSGSSLESVCIPSSVEQMGERCFAYCRALSTVTFEAGSKLLRFGSEAFVWCKALTSICIPASVETISESCFQSCTALSALTFETGSHVSVFERAAFYGLAIESICIPASVTRVAEYCFGDCWALTEVTFALGSPLAKLDEIAFSAFLGQ